MLGVALELYGTVLSPVGRIHYQDRVVGLAVDEAHLVEKWYVAMCIYGVCVCVCVCESDGRFQGVCVHACGCVSYIHVHVCVQVNL